ncbi:hypothetical protein JTB14_032823 [Gonioctena quinquepunctata]|nr:hypothetical protein JTB14_032823 [Gonioctena quinquepunctata]
MEKMMIQNHLTTVMAVTSKNHLPPTVSLMKTIDNNWAACLIQQAFSPIQSEEEIEPRLDEDDILHHKGQRIQIENSIGQASSERNEKVVKYFGRPMNNKIFAYGKSLAPFVANFARIHIDAFEQRK